VETSIDLAPDVAADLDLARVLAKALADEVGEPSILALSEALDRFDDPGDERATVLAREILPLSDRIAPAIETAIPEVAIALEAATPAIGELAKAQWSRAYINNLPDDAFLYIEPGGSHDADGKTVPRSLRHFPYRNHTGNLDAPHLQNAIDRIP